MTPVNDREQTPIDQVEAGPACAAYLCKQLALPKGSIKTYGELEATMHTLRDRLNAEHGETMGTIKYMEHLAEMHKQALASTAPT